MQTFTPSDATVSVVVPVYNAGATLSACVKSVRAQGYSDWELILVNDGSKDDSGELCERFAREDARIRAVAQSNQGVSAARNRGLQLARGAYVAFLDADDEWEEDFLATLVPLIKNTRADAAICGYWMQLPTGAWREIRIREDVCETAEAIGNYFAGQNIVINTLWNKLYVRARITEGFDTGMSLGEDLKFNLTYFKGCGKIACISTPLYRYGYNGQSSLGNRFKDDRFDLAKWQYQSTRAFLRALAPKADLFIIRREVVTNAWRYINKLILYAGKTGKETRARIDSVLKDAVWTDVFSDGLACNRSMKAFKLCAKLRPSLLICMAVRLREWKNRGKS